MSKKAFVRTICIFIAAIAAVFAIGAALPGMRPRPQQAILIPKTGEEDFEFWESVERGAMEGAREYGVELQVRGPKNEADIEGQTRLVYEAIAEKPDMILLAACDMEALVEPAQAVRDAGIVLVLLDCGIEVPHKGRIADCFVGINNKEAGGLLGEEMADRLPGGGKVAILAPSPNTSSAAGRIEGIEQTLSAYPDIEIVETVRCGVTAEEAEQAMNRILRENPGLAGVFCVNPVCTEGAAHALSGRSPEEHVFLFAFDTSVSQNAYLEEGIVDGFVAQIAFNLGYLSVESGYLACRDELRTSRMDSGYVYATKENMRDEAIQKLIYPF